MSAPALYLFDDGRARRWAPFSLTRPIGELLLGTKRLRAHTEASFGLECRGHLSRSALSGFSEVGAAPVVSRDEVRTETGAILISSRVLIEGAAGPLPIGPVRIEMGGFTVGWVIPPGGDIPSDLWLRDPTSAPSTGDVLALEGTKLEHPWDLIQHNARRLALDLEAGTPATTPRGVIRVGDHALSIEPSAQVEAGVVLDTRHGPIRLEAGVTVEGPARLVGPLFVGDGSSILGGHVGHSSIGRQCKVRGELSASILGDFVNKAHDGHIGHAVIGSWVNLGAGTTNSDLKNNYGTVSVWTPDGDLNTGLIKVGCFLGDHVKTGIGTLLNTGTVIGAGSNIFGGAMPPVAVPPFSWGTGRELTTHHLDKFIQTTERVMARRGMSLSDPMKALFERAWTLTASQRSEGSA